MRWRRPLLLRDMQRAAWTFQYDSSPPSSTEAMASRSAGMSLFTHFTHLGARDLTRKVLVLYASVPTSAYVCRHTSGRWKAEGCFVLPRSTEPLAVLLRMISPSTLRATDRPRSREDLRILAWWMQTRSTPTVEGPYLVPDLWGQTQKRRSGRVVLCSKACQRLHGVGCPNSHSDPTARSVREVEPFVSVPSQ